MRYPEFLKENGRIGYIAPSFGCVTEPYRTCFESAVAKLEAKGFRTVKGPNVYEDKGLGKSNTPEKCGAEINDFFLNDRCDVIISCGGGETMCEDLPFVDFEGIAKAPPKWYLGYSDNTNLTFTLPTLCDTAAIYGPCAANFGMEPWHPAINDCLDLLTGKKLAFASYDKWEKDQIKDAENPLVPYNAAEPYCMQVFTPDGRTDASVSGRLIGGCLDCLQTLCGTKFDKAPEFAEKYKDDGILWFIESCDLNPMGIRRALWQLDAAGWFAHVSGFLIGRAYHFDDDFAGMNRINAVTGILEKYKVPIFMDVDIGHLPPQMPIVSGACAKVRAESGRLTLKTILQ
ncbi:MAG: LD-carboxypeptidase [Eubacterium sp.]|nr:LD-carboxypeptidase [Eubacterium sp.]